MELADWAFVAVLILKLLDLKSLLNYCTFWTNEKDNNFPITFSFGWNFHTQFKMSEYGYLH